MLFRSDVTKEIESAPAAEDTPVDDDSSSINEDLMILKMASGQDYDVPAEEPGEQEVDNDPFGDSSEEDNNTEDELSAAANVPNTQSDDDVDPTPTMPINGACETDTQEPVEEKGSAVKRSYHKHYSADAGYGDNDQEAVEEGATDYIKLAMGDAKDSFFNKLPGNKKVKFAALGVSALIFFVKVIFPEMRLIVAMYYQTRANISESLAAQADLVELNALELQNNENTNLTDEKKAKVVEKQLKIAEKLRKWSERFAIKDKKAQKDAQKEIESEDKKNKSSDMTNLTDGDDDLF